MGNVCLRGAARQTAALPVGEPKKNSTLATQSASKQCSPALANVTLQEAPKQSKVWLLTGSGVPHDARQTRDAADSAITLIVAGLLSDKNDGNGVSHAEHSDAVAVPSSKALVTTYLVAQTATQKANDVHDTSTSGGDDCVGGHFLDGHSEGRTYDYTGGGCWGTVSPYMGMYEASCVQDTTGSDEDYFFGDCSLDDHSISRDHEYSSDCWRHDDGPLGNGYVGAGQP